MTRVVGGQRWEGVRTKLVSSAPTCHWQAIVRLACPLALALVLQRRTGQFAATVAEWPVALRALERPGGQFPRVAAKVCDETSRLIVD